MGFRIIGPIRFAKRSRTGRKRKGTVTVELPDVPSEQPKCTGMKQRVSVRRTSKPNASWTSFGRGSGPHFVACIDNHEYEVSLEPRKIYRTLPDADAAKHGMIRVIDETGEDYLYPASYFVPIEVPEALEALLLAS